MPQFSKPVSDFLFCTLLTQSVSVPCSFFHFFRVCLLSLPHTVMNVLCKVICKFTLCAHEVMFLTCFYMLY